MSMLSITWVIYHISHNFLIIFFPLLIKFLQKINIIVPVESKIYFAPAVLKIPESILYSKASQWCHNNTVITLVRILATSQYHFKRWLWMIIIK